MVSKVFLTIILIFLPLTTSAQYPQLWKEAINLANSNKGSGTKMQPYLMEFFNIPHPKKISAKEIYVPKWLVAVFQPEGYSKPLILVRSFETEVSYNEYGVDAKKGHAWLLDNQGRPIQTCQWDNKKVVGRAQNVKDWEEYESFIYILKAWVSLRGNYPPPRE